MTMLIEDLGAELSSVWARLDELDRSKTENIALDRGRLHATAGAIENAIQHLAPRTDREALIQLNVIRDHLQDLEFGSTPQAVSMTALDEVIKYLEERFSVSLQDLGLRQNIPASARTGEQGVGLSRAVATQGR